MPKADNRRRQGSTTIRDDHRLEQGFVAATVIAVLLVFVPAMNDTYVLPKFVVLVLGVIGLLAVIAWRASDRASLEIPTSPGAVLVAVVLLAMVVATIAGEHPAQSIVGNYGRSDGLVTYTAAAIMFLAVLIAYGRREMRTLAGVVCAAGSGIIAYGLLQALGMQPVAINPDGAQVISTLGQANFVAGSLAIFAPLLLWVLTDRTRSVGLRRAAGVAGAATLIVAARAQSFQVLPAVILSLGVTGSVLAAERWGTRRVVRMLGAAVLVGAVLAVVFSTRLEAEVRSGLDERVLFWQAALDMFRDAPILGRGLNGFANSFAAFRPEAHSLRFGAFQIADAPHDVPLAMLVSGGLVLGLAYLAFVGFVGLRLVQGLRRLEGPPRALLAATGGAWVGYQAQSLVSIDVPPLILTHFVLAAMILVLADDRRTRPVALPWQPRGRGRSAQTSGIQLAVRIAVAVAMLISVVLVLRPAQADLAFAGGLDRRPPADSPPDVRDPANNAAIPHLRRSTELAPWVARYWAELAAAYAAIGDQDSALDAGRKAADRGPSVVSYALAVSQLAERSGEVEMADEYSSMALGNSPNDPVVLNARAEFLLRAERFEEAVSLLERAHELRPDDVAYLLHLAAAYTGAGEDEKAEEAYEAVLELAPENPEALAALGREPTP